MNMRLLKMLTQIEIGCMCTSITRQLKAKLKNSHSKHQYDYLIHCLNINTSQDQKNLYYENITAIMNIHTKIQSNCIRIVEATNNGKYYNTANQMLLDGLVYAVYDCNDEYVPLHNQINQARTDEEEHKSYLSHAKDLLNCLQEMESLKILHNDIRPLNIYINKQNQLYLGGWDFATVNNVDKFRLRKAYIAKQFGICSTFVAPEVFNSELIANQCRSDVFSVGVVLYFMLKKFIPFINATDATFKAYIQNNETGSSISDIEKAIKKKMLSENPDARALSNEILKDAAFAT